MNRRQLLIGSGAALGLHGATAHAKPKSTTGGTATTRASATKLLLKHRHVNTIYNVPKSTKKADKYIGSLAAALSLTADQVEQSSAIFSRAAARKAQLKDEMKAARKGLKAAARNSDMVAINRAAETIGNVKAQLISSAASAQLDFYALLQPNQKATLFQFRTESK